MTKNVAFRDLGLADYQAVWDLQRDLFRQTIDQKIQNRRNNTNIATTHHLLLVEHPPVITMGKSGKDEHLLLDKQRLEDLNIQYFKIDRGGDITFHGPGQVVGYPILDLDHFFTDIHKYLRLLEQTIINTLSDFGLSASRSSGETGVWLDVDTPFARKICAMGVRASRWVTMHGFALNVNTDLSAFEHIVPCGIQGKGITSMARELDSVVDIDQVKKKIMYHFEQLFEAKLTY